MVVGRNGDALWIRRFHPSPDAGTRLVCFAHAGGSASYFHALSAALAPAIEVLAVQYPGRQDRRAEPFVDDLHLLAELITDALAPWTDRPLAFFGHSMGATLAFETARRLEPRDVALREVFVSGRCSPTASRAETVHLRDDAGLLEELGSLSGTDPRLLRDGDIRDMILPALRNDYRAVETYRYRAGPLLRCPIVALLGESDPKVTVDEARDWARHTTGEFDLRLFPGGHFYLNDHLGAVADLVAASAAKRSAAERAA
jgi:surfactin synthase thioesterase subunit